MFERIKLEWRGHYRLDVNPKESEFDAQVVEVTGGQTLLRLEAKARLRSTPQKRV